MSSEDRSKGEELGEAREEISRLKGRLANERFAEDLRDALTLAATAGAISSPVEHSRLLEMIVETAAGVIPSRSAALFLIDEEAEELVFQVALGPEAEQVKNLRIPLGHGIAGLVAVSGQPMAVSDAAKDPRQAADVAESVGYAPESILCVPLVHEEEVIGVLELLDREGAPSFDASDMGALGLFANQAAVAIEQSRAQGNLAALLGGVLGSLGGLPEHRTESLREGTEPFAARVEEDSGTRCLHAEIRLESREPTESLAQHYGTTHRLSAGPSALCGASRLGNDNFVEDPGVEPCLRGLTETREGLAPGQTTPRGGRYRRDFHGSRPDRRCDRPTGGREDTDQLR